MTPKHTEKSTKWMEDGDDAHFESLKKRHGKKRVGAAGKGHLTLRASNKTSKKTAHKRVVGK